MPKQHVERAAFFPVSRAVSQATLSPVSLAGCGLQTWRPPLLARLFLLLAILSFLLPIHSTAQQVYDGNQNLPPFGSFAGSDFDVVSLQNGNLHIRIPLADVKQRQGRASFDFIFDTPEFLKETNQETDPQGRRTTVTVVDPSLVGWGLTAGGDSRGWGVISSSYQVTCGASSTAITHTYVVRDPQGTMHPVPLVTGGCTAVTTDRGPALDGSGIFLSIDPTNGTVIKLKDGTQIIPLANREDSNGNIGSASIDNLGRGLVNRVDNGPAKTFTTPLGRTLNRSYTNSSINYIDSAGATQAYQIDYTAIDIQTSFTSPCRDTSCSELNTGSLVPSKLTLPNGKFYQFNWVNASAGQLQSIILPTGASISYTYVSSCVLAPTAVPVATHLHAYDCREAVQSRAVTVGTSVSTWNYSLIPGSGVGSVTVTDPAGNDEVHTFGPITIGTTLSLGRVETSAKQYSGSASAGILLRQTVTDYTGEVTVRFNTSYVDNLRPIRKTTTLDNGLVTKTETDYETFTYTEGTGSPTATRLNPTEVREYDYASGAPGALLRRTDYTYRHQGDSTYTGLNIVDRQTSVITYDGSGNKLAQTTYEYDVYNHTGMPGMGASGAVQHDSARSTSYLTRGNVTAVNRWLNTTGTSLTTLNQYDDAGNLIATKDPEGNLTSYDYTDSWANTTCAPSGGQGKGYPTTVTNALGRLAKSTYNSCTGTRASSKDQNDINAGRTGTTYTYDLLNRSISVSFPDGGQITNCYTDVGGSGCPQTGPPFQLVTTQKINTSQNKIATKVFDGLGRVSQTQLNSDPDGVTYIDTTYDAIGNVHSVSNPHRSASATTDGITTYVYDALHRICVTAPPDGTVPSGTSCPATQPTNDVFTVYSGNTATVTDQAGKKRKGTTNGLGQLTQVTEDPGGLGYVTSYTYDVLDNLNGVIQNGSRQRTFVYDSLSRLTSASNPESGTTIYKYDSDTACASPNSFPGQLVSKLDARGIRICMQYDALNRVKWKKYLSGTMYAGFGYDGNDESGNPISGITNAVGRLTHSSNQVNAASTYSYDPIGRVVLKRGCVPLNCVDTAFPVAITYDLAGDVTSYTNGAGVTLTQTFDTAGRLAQINSSLNDSQHPATLYTVDPSIGYFPSGALRKATLANGLAESAMYNTRLQPCRMEISSSTTVSFVQCTDGVPTGNVLDFTYGYNSGSSNNGNVATWSSVGNQTFTRSYLYDSLNRISTLADTATAQTCKGLSWTIDPWGNRTDQNVTAGSCGTFHSTVGANNRLGSPYQYDAAGNMTYDGTHSYTYDDESRLTKVDGGNTATYVYDAEGRRAEKSVAGVRTDFVYDPSGNVVAETNGSGWQVSYVYANGSLIAQYRDGTTYSIFRDHLGSTRLITKLDKSVYDSLDFLPYGEQIGGDTGTTHKFAGKERDSESGLDNFGARYDSSSMGRFMSPDPLGGHRVDPQTLNKYSYVRNNPVNLTDPTGLDFNLTCQKEDDTCHKGLAGTYSKPDDNGNRTFTATVISNDKNGNLVDQNGSQYNATVSGAGVSFSQAGSNQPGSMGVFINNSNATTIQGTGGLAGFTFNFTYSNWAGNVTAGGTFTYGGTFQQAESALGKAGFQHYASDDYDIFHLSGLSGHAVDFRSAGEVGTGAGSGHLTVDEPWMFYPYMALKSPTQGDVHLGEHNNSTPGGFWPHTGEVLRTLWWNYLVPK